MLNFTVYYQGVLINLILTLSLNVIVVFYAFELSKNENLLEPPAERTLLALKAESALKLVIESIKERLRANPVVLLRPSANY